MHRRLLDAGLSVAPAYGNKTRDSFVGDVNFDANMVIILAALLCALICALGLNSIVRCVLRCSRRFSPDITEQTAARLSSKGLKKRHLNQIPVKEYGPGANIPATECPICLGEFEKGDKVRMLPKCNHGFHVRCIDTWLLSHSSCPNCRHSLLEKSTNPSPNSNSNSNSNSNRRIEGGAVAGSQAPADGSGDTQVHAVVVDERRSGQVEEMVRSERDLEI